MLGVPWGHPTEECVIIRSSMARILALLVHETLFEFMTKKNPHHLGEFSRMNGKFG